MSIKYPCLTCRGQGYEQIQERREIDIPRGIKKGHNLRIGGLGNREKGSAGDLLIRMEIEDH